MTQIHLHKIHLLKLLAVCIILYFMYHLNMNHIIMVDDKLKISIKDRTLLLADVHGVRHALKGNIGEGIPDDTPVSSCEEGNLCVVWKNFAKLTVTSSESGKMKCYKMSWEALSLGYNPSDSYEITGSHWFGGPEVYEQRWPINKQQTPLQQFKSDDYLMSEPSHQLVGPIAEPYWFNSDGAAILVDSGVNLHVGANDNNDGLLRLRADYEGTLTPVSFTRNLKLSYTICLGKDAKEVHSLVAAKFIDRPLNLPDKRMLNAPIWSSWARYKTGVSQENIMQYAGEIEKYGFPNSQIEIDDMYTITYGDFDFDTKKFPDPKTMISELHSRGFRVTSWVTPFANVDSQAFKEGMDKDYWVLDAKGRVPGLVKWWQGVGAALDVTNPDAVKWFVDRLEKLRDELGMDSFKFDAGEIGHLPLFVKTHQTLVNANEYTRHYADMVARFGNAVEMRAAYRNQKHTMFVRMMDKDSVWGYDNGLKTMIPTALMMSVTGYHYILPDMIGGNGYGPVGNMLVTDIPPKELFVRWMQLSAYLPSMQFSFTPWQYDDEVVAIGLAMVKRHTERVVPAFLKAASAMLKHGTPIIRPVWWLAPDDHEALVCDSAFLIGDEMLVAPILNDGARMRDIYLPKGRWHDDLREKDILGSTWLRDYPADLKDIPTFTYLGTQ